jgi:hypothetical protein
MDRRRRRRKKKKKKMMMMTADLNLDVQETHRPKLAIF